MRQRDGSFTRAEVDVLRIVCLTDTWDDGAPLGKATDPSVHTVKSQIARRLAGAGILSIDAGAHAHLTDEARQLELVRGLIARL